MTLVLGFVACGPAYAQDTEKKDDNPSTRAATFGTFLLGGATGLLLHESGHLVFDFAFDADPAIRKVDFHGIPFFAISHRDGLPRRKEFVISSAGFWVQHAGSEWILSRRPRLRDERAPFAKGVLAFNVLTSTAYAGAAFARTGPVERDTRGMAESSGIDERWIGALVLAPAALDAWRYYDPKAKWAEWISRGVKVLLVLLTVRA
jgi:hypothetical protein